MVSSVSAYIRLMRIDRPIGTYLLLWPTLWGLWIAAKGMPDTPLIIIFVTGVVLTRAAGCVINDFADRKIDGHVARTQQRPLATGEITSKQALTLFTVLLLTAFVLVLFTNTLTIKLSCVAVGLAVIYPFVKRISHLPQLILGLAFSWGIPMAFAAQINTVPTVAWLLFMAAVLMTVAYDTYYAMVDADDDIRIGVKSTALLFGKHSRTAIAILQMLVLAILLLAGVWLGMGLFYYVGLFTMASLFLRQYLTTRSQDKTALFHAFLNNHWASFAVWLGIVLNYYQG